ncbi:hypothetical protein F4781DRAFT_394085 [Annulohypoxylon bovei var. microspora]|nr:hypothetical protein F4781DRAFT_394085 [Annulohypoxylon bovei var. microspora]
MDQNVYIGVWINWSRGKILGATLTTTQAYGNLLIAFTAFFVALVASRFWRILCLILHRSYSTTQQRAAIHHQRQVVLRNSASAEAGLISFIRIVWAWKKSPWRHLIGLILPIVISLFLLVAFTVAGGFTSSISTAVGDDVLLKSFRCGPMPWVAPDIDSQMALSAANAEKMDNAANYAQQCYSVSGLEVLECNKFVASRLPAAETNMAAPCPFQSGICRSQDSNVRFDTGYIDSNDHLGLNAPNDDRVGIRYVLECAPLKTEGYTTNFAADGRKFVQYNYGTRQVGSKDNLTHEDFIWRVEDIDSQYYRPNATIKSAKDNYELSYLASITFQGQAHPSGQFVPMPELARPDGDVMLIFLSGNGVRFIQSLDDDWYRATTQDGSASATSLDGRRPLYRPNEAASPMGCVQQWQWCTSADPKPRRCGPLASRNDALYGAAPLFNLSMEEMDSVRPVAPEANGARFLRQALIWGQKPIAIEPVLSFLGSKSLISQVHFYESIQFTIPVNQWQLDVNHWWNIALASAQAEYVQVVQGIDSPTLDMLRQTPVNEAEQALCDNQKIRSASHSSFSLLGIVITFGIGGMIIVVSFIVEPILEFLYKRRKYKQYAYLEWITNTSLQLQRLAHENLELGNWSHCTEEVPTTEPGVALASLDIKNPDHPSLRRYETMVEKSESRMRGSSEAPLNEAPGGLANQDEAVDEPTSLRGEASVSLLSIRISGISHDDISDLARSPSNSTISWSEPSPRVSQVDPHAITAAVLLERDETQH